MRRKTLFTALVVLVLVWIISVSSVAAFGTSFFDETNSRSIERQTLHEDSQATSLLQALSDENHQRTLMDLDNQFEAQPDENSNVESPQLVEGFHLNLSSSDNVSNLSMSTVFSEGFEGAFPGDNWLVGDANSNNGLDYWDDTSYRAHTGSWSGWCAQIGSQTSTYTLLYEDFEGEIYVTVENKGEWTETFNITVYANETIIGSENFTLESGSSAVITFTFNATDLANGNYTIWAYATRIPGETDISDNAYADGWVVVTVAGDVNCDFNVNYWDLFLLARAYGSAQSDSNWNPLADFNSDGRVNYIDLFMLARNYGVSGP